MSDRKIAIAVVAPQEPFESFSDFWEGVWSAAYELAPFGVQVDSILLETFDAADQAQSLEGLLQPGLDALVFLPADSQQFDELIDRHVRRGTSVVTVFNDAPLSRRALFVGPDYRLSGRLAAEMLENVLQPGSRIATLAGSQTNARLKQQYEGFLGTLRKSRPPFWLAEYDTPEALLNEMRAADFPFDGLYVGCSESVLLGEILGCIKEPVRAVTFGATEITKPYLKSGTLCAIIDSSLFYQGYFAVQKAYECVHAQALESMWVPVPSSVMLTAHAAEDAQSSSMNTVVQTVLQQKTRQLQSYKQKLDLANALIMRGADTDSLTGLLNHRKFNEVLEAAVAACTDDSPPVALLVIAIEDLEAIAVLLGQAAADQAVQEVAGALRGTCGPNDILARIESDEFAVLVTQKQLTSVPELEHRIVDAIGEARMAADQDFVFSVNVGRAWTPLHGRTAAELKCAAKPVVSEGLRKTG